MIKPNTIWISKKNVPFRLLAVLPDDDDKWKPEGEQSLTAYAAQCYPKHDDGSDNTSFESVALPVAEFIKDYFPCPVK